MEAWGAQYKLMTRKTSDCICPLFASAEDTWQAVSSSETLSFLLNGFPNWSAEWFGSAAVLKTLPLSAEQDFWLRPALSAYLASSPQGVEHSLLRLQHKDYPDVWLSVQTFIFQPKQQIRQAPDRAIVRWGFRRWLSGLFSFKVLTLGQFMVSGEHGAIGLEKLDFDPAPLLHAAALAMAKQSGGYWAILVKDLQPAQAACARSWQEMGYYQLPVDPSMQLPIKADWRDFSDYLLDLTSKYRVRYRRARKQLGNISKRALTPAEGKQYQKELFEHYLAVKEEASFDAISLSPDYFSRLQSLFQGEVQLFGYFQEDRLVGFYSSIANGSTLHAHYLGFDQAINQQHHLYHNMLFDMLEQAITEKYKVLDLGRTALEIKSSVGAEPVTYCCGLYGLSPLTRLAIQYFTPAVFKASEWQARSPFK